jgi:23S rRNA pseudouridine2605 synthase
MIMIHDPQRNDETASGQGERVAKALARAGVASRRDVEKLIEEGRVALNGKVLTTPAVNVLPDDILTVDGEVVDAAEPTRLFRYHKPIDLLTTHKDPQGRATVFDALPPGLPRLISIGRLDINSEGLLLLTNDGELARALEQPSSGVVRVYRVRARGRVTQADLDKLKDGVTVEGVRYGPLEAKIDKAKEGPSGANVWITVTIAEGKNREVRKVLKSVGLEVGRLIRMSYGPFALGTLPIGQIEEVGPRVIREQLVEHIAPENLPTGDRPSFKPPKAPPGAHAVHDGTGRRGAGARPAAEPKPKASYKEGWARPKVEIKAGAVKRRRAPRPGEEASDVPVAPRRRSPRIPGDTPGGIRSYAPGDPLAPPRPPRPTGPKRKPGSDAPRRGATLIERGPRSNDGKPAKPRGFGGLRPEGRSSDGPRGDWGGPPRSGPRGPRPEGDAPRGEGRPERDGPRGPRPSGPRPAGKPGFGGPRSGPRPGGPRSDAPRGEGRPERADGPRGPRPAGKPGFGGPRSGPRPDGPRSDAPRGDGPRSDRPRSGGGGKPGGPRPGGPRPGGPRGPKRDG